MIEEGSRVKIHFVGTLDDGAMFYSTHVQGGAPMQIEIGKHEILPAMEREIASMEVGERKTVRIPAADAYGEYDASLTETVPLAALPNADKLTVGEYVIFNTEVGPLRVKVLSKENGNAVFDYNHELAGQALTFKIDLLAVMSAEERAVEREEFYRGDECGCKKVLGHDHDCECALLE